MTAMPRTKTLERPAAVGAEDAHGDGDHRIDARREADEQPADEGGRDREDRSSRESVGERAAAGSCPRVIGEGGGRNEQG
jgi:hypothetical protein